MRCIAGFPCPEVLAVMPELPPQRDAPPPSNPSFWRRAVPWIVVYGLLLAILFFALA